MFAPSSTIDDPGLRKGLRISQKQNEKQAAEDFPNIGKTKYHIMTLQNNFKTPPLDISKMIGTCAKHKKYKRNSSYRLPLNNNRSSLFLNCCD